MNLEKGGYILLIMAACYLLRDKAPLIGRLPGDFEIYWKKLYFFFPITSTILIYIITSIFKSY